MSEPNRKPRQFAIGGGLVITTWCALGLGLYSASGVFGISAAFAVIALSWFFVSRTTSPALHPLNARKMTVVELMTMLAIAGVLYGLSLPSHPIKLAV